MTGLRLVSIVAAFSIAVAVALPQGLGKKSRDDSGKERQNSSQRSEQRSRGNSQERIQPQRRESWRSDSRDYQPRQQSQRQEWQPRQQSQREDWQPRERQEIQKREEVKQPRDQRDWQRKQPAREEWQPRQPAREEWIPNSDNTPRQRKDVPGWEGHGNFNREPQGKPERGGQSGLGKKGGNQGGSGKSQEPEKKPERGGPPERGGGESGLGGFPQRGGGSGNDPRGDRPQIGRIERPQWQGSQGQGQLERRRESNLKYGTINNLATRGDTGPIRIGRAPVKALRSLPSQVIREERVRVLPRDCRTGYFAYTRNWCDDDFLFRWYAFDCYPATRVYCSPWYYYPHLPAYLTPGCVSILSINLGPVQWYNYNYRSSSYYEPYGYGGGYYNGSGYYGGYNRRYNDRTDLDYAIDDLVRAFERNDRRSIENLIPTYGDVHIWVDGEYSYSMQADRFYDLMMDNVTSTRTRSYEIVRVRTYRDEAEVLARHEFVNPWGDVDCVYHWFRLERERGGYVIRHFGTSNYRAW